MHKNQSGRSMTEMLGVLAVMGILSITALLGYNYAVNKGHANRLLKDVEMAYVAATSQENCVVGKLHPIEFKATSAYPIWTECLQGDTLQTNIVIAKQVQKAVCEMVWDVAESSQWRVYSADAQTNLFAEVTSCDDDMALIFALDDITDMMFACDKECPENMMCNINDECVCAYGYEMNEATNDIGMVIQMMTVARQRPKKRNTTSITNNIA